MKPNRKRRILHNIDLSEISLVDAPAVEPALVALIKQRKEQGMTDEPTTFEAAVAMFKRQGLPGTAAMQRAHAEYGGLFEAYQKRAPAPAAKEVGNGDAIAKFRRIVSEIAKRDSCPSTEAMRRAAAEHPEELKAFQAD